MLIEYTLLSMVIYGLYYIFHQINIYSIDIYIMFLSLKQQVSNTNNDVSTFESKLHELKEKLIWLYHFIIILLKTMKTLK